MALRLKVKKHDAIKIGDVLLTFVWNASDGLFVVIDNPSKLTVNLLKNNTGIKPQPVLTENTGSFSGWDKQSKAV